MPHNNSKLLKSEKLRNNDTHSFNGPCGYCTSAKTEKQMQLKLKLHRKICEICNSKHLITPVPKITLKIRVNDYT